MDHLPDERSLRLPFRAPFAAETLLSFLGARAVPGIEDVREGMYMRSVRQSGSVAVIAMTPQPEKGHVSLDVSSDGAFELTGLVRDARRAFDLDADPEVIDEVLLHDAELAPLVRRTPGIRVPGTFDPFELVVRAIFGQQVSVSGARTSLGRFAARFGTPLDHPTGGMTHLFPSADQVTEIPPDALEMPRSRAEAIRRVAELVVAGKLDLSDDAPTEEALHLLGEVRGIGPWTLAYVAMRPLHHPDAFLSSDLGVRKGFQALGLPSTTKAILERAERWRPWRAYAVMHLWQAHP